MRVSIKSQELTLTSIWGHLGLNSIKIKGKLAKHKNPKIAIFHLIFALAGHYVVLFGHFFFLKDVSRCAVSDGI